MPASTNVVQKGQKCTWGTNDVTGLSGAGVVVSASLDAKASTEMVEDENGAAVGLVLYDERYSGSVTLVAKESSKAPQIGDQITLGDMKAYVAGTRTDWQNKGKKQFTVTVEGGKNINN